MAFPRMTAHAGGMILAVLAGVTTAVAQTAAPAHVILRAARVSTFQRQLQDAADRNYRVAARLLAPDFAVILEKNASRPAVEYLVLSTQKTSTLDAELTAAAATGFQLASVLGGTNLLLERPKGSTAPTHQYRILATELRTTLERELEGPASVGFHVVGQSRAAGGRVNQIEFMAILERPATDTDREAVDYRLIDAIRLGTLEDELSEAAASGYRLVPSRGAWDSAMLLEKSAAVVAEYEYRILSHRTVDAMQKAIDTAAADGYALATVLRHSNLKSEIVIVMERRKGVRTPARVYRILPWNGLTLMGRRNLEAERRLMADMDNGFRLADQVTFPHFWSATGGDPAVILERETTLAP